MSDLKERELKTSSDDLQNEDITEYLSSHPELLNETKILGFRYCVDILPDIFDKYVWNEMKSSIKDAEKHKDYIKKCFKDIALEMEKRFIDEQQIRINRPHIYINEEKVSERVLQNILDDLIKHEEFENRFTHLVLNSIIRVEPFSLSVKNFKKAFTIGIKHLFELCRYIKKEHFYGINVKLLHPTKSINSIYGKLNEPIGYLYYPKEKIKYPYNFYNLPLGMSRSPLFQKEWRPGQFPTSCRYNPRIDYEIKYGWTLKEEMYATFTKLEQDIKDAETDEAREIARIRFYEFLINPPVKYTIMKDPIATIVCNNLINLLEDFDGSEVMLDKFINYRNILCDSANYDCDEIEQKEESNVTRAPLLTSQPPHQF